MPPSRRRPPGRRRLLVRRLGRDDLGGDLLRHRRVGLEVVGGPQERRLVGVGRGDLRHDASAEDHDRPVAGELDLLELGRVEQHCGALPREVAQELVDLLLGADVDAARRVEAEHRPDAARDPPGDRHLLLVAAGQAADLGRRAGVDLERRDRRVDLLAFAADVDQPPRRDPRAERQGDVLADRALHQQRLGAVGRDVDEARPDRVRGMAERDGHPIDEQLTAARPLGAGEDVEQLVLALALERDDAEHLARVELERDVAELRPALRSRASIRGVASSARAPATRAGASAAAAGMSRAMSPSIRPTIRSSAPSVTSTTPTVTPSRRTVARSQTAAISISRWEMKITERSRALLAADHLEDPLGQVGRQGRGHLVEHQDVGLDGQGPREVDDPERGEGQVAGQLAEVEVRQAELGEPVADRLRRRSRQAQVRADVEVGDERRLLVDGDDAAARGPRPASAPRTAGRER